MKKLTVLFLIIGSAVAFGFEAAAMIMKLGTHNIGYIIGIGLFVAAIFVGVKNHPKE